VTTHTLLKYPETLAVVRLGPGTEIPAWAESSSIFSVTATANETSLICAGRNVPKKAKALRGLNAYCVAGTVDFGPAGTLVGLLAPVAEADVSVFNVCTHDTTWILVPKDDAERAEEAWRRSGFEIAAATPTT
jgi:hypothetical protein